MTFVMSPEPGPLIGKEMTHISFFVGSAMSGRLSRDSEDTAECLAHTERTDFDEVEDPCLPICSIARSRPPLQSTR
jgi:hypothetical protein